MLNGWNRKVRTTSAMARACRITGWFRPTLPRICRPARTGFRAARSSLMELLISSISSNLARVVPVFAWKRKSCRLLLRRIKNSACGRGYGLENHLRLRQRIFIGQGEVDHGLAARRNQAASRLAAPPVRCRVGCPEGSLTTPMSSQLTPWLMPVPSALAQASLAANRLA